MPGGFRWTKPWQGYSPGNDFAREESMYRFVNNCLHWHSQLMSSDKTQKETTVEDEFYIRAVLMRAEREHDGIPARVFNQVFKLMFVNKHARQKILGTKTFNWWVTKHGVLLERYLDGLREGPDYENEYGE